MATANNSYLLRIQSAESTSIDPWLPRIQNNDEYLELGLTFAPPEPESSSSNTANEEFQPVGDVGAVRLANALKSNDHLRFLDLSRNGIRGVGGAALAKALFRRIDGTSSDHCVSRTALQSLDLSENQIVDEGAAAFAQMLKFNTSLKRLDLSFNGISFQHVIELLGSLEMNSTLTAIYLTGNLKKMNARDMSHLVKILCYVISWNQLEVLNLRSEQFKDKESKSVYEFSLGGASDQDVLTLLQTIYGVPHHKQATELSCNLSNEYKIQIHRLRELSLPSGKDQSTNSADNAIRMQFRRVLSFNAFYHPILELHDFLSSTRHTPKYFDSKLPNHLQRDIHSGALVGLLPLSSFNNTNHERSIGIHLKAMPHVFAFAARECNLDTFWNVLRYRTDLFRYAGKSFRMKGRVTLDCADCQIL